jgi:integrase/recombinase XerD
MWSVEWMTLVREVTERHVLWLKVAAWLAQLAPTTQRTYLSIIKEYSAFLGAKAGTKIAAELMAGALPVHALAYVQQLKRQKGQAPRINRLARREGKPAPVVASSSHSPATIAKKIMCLRKLYEVLVAHGCYTNANPFSPHLVPVPNARGGRKRDTEALDFDDVPLVIDAIEDGPRATRDRAIICALFGGGLRRCEVVKLLIGDVALTSAGTTFLLLRSTKDGQDHQQALPEWAAEAVWSLVEERIEAGAAQDDPLFVTWTGKGGTVPTERPMSDASVYLIFKRACEAAGLSGAYTPHSARATAITKLLADGTPHREVQEFSRHKSVQMVEWYDKRRFGVDRSPAKGLSFTPKKKKAA